MGAQVPRRIAIAAVSVTLLTGCVPDAPPEPESSADPQVRKELVNRAVHTSTTLADGSVVVAGGCVIDGCGTATDTVFELEATGAVSPAPPMTTSRAGHSAVGLLDNAVLVVGGFTGEGAAPLASTEVRQPGGKWDPFASLRLGRGGNGLAVLGNGSAIVVGGWLGPRRYTETTEILDPLTNTFEYGPDLPVAADGLAAVTMSDGSVLVTGGQVAPGVATDMAVVVSADGQHITPVGPLVHPRFKHATVLLPSGEVLVIGGTSDDRALLTSTELFDPESKTFREGPALVNGRYKLTGSTVVLPDGSVLVGGGGEGVELIDVEGGVATVRSEFTTRVGSFDTINLLGEQVLHLGGYDRQIRLTRTYEVVPVSTLASEPE